MWNAKVDKEKDGNYVIVINFIVTYDPSTELDNNYKHNHNCAILWYK